MSDTFPRDGLTLGVDIGGTKTLVGVIDRDGRVRSFARGLTPADQGPNAILDNVAALARQVLTGSQANVRACGVGSAGTIGPNGTVTNATDHLRDWVGTDITEGLQRRLALPAIAVNDVHAAALGESWVGIPSAADRMFFVAVGTGIGAAIITGGELVRGLHGAAGSLGHTVSSRRDGRVCSCGGIDHVEAFASGPGIEKSFRESAGAEEHVPLREIGERAAGGDAAASSVIVDAAELLGDAIANAVCLIDPGLVVLGGGVSGLGDLFVLPLRERIRERLSSLCIEPALRIASLGNEAAIVGAGLLAQRLLGHQAETVLG